MTNTGVGRSWGEWTVIKLDALSTYLKQFTVASQRAHRTLYLDLFAGTTENTSRQSGQVLPGSAVRAIQTVPEFTKIVLCELDRGKAATLRGGLASSHANRDIDVLAGDCNDLVPRHLEKLAQADPGWRRTPAFAFIDQYSAEITWDTLKFLANFRISDRGFRTELWLYLGDSFIVRGLGQKDRADRVRYEERVDAMYGSQAWREIHLGRQRGLLTPKDALDEYVNLMRWRLEKELGYTTTIGLRMSRESGHGLYYMIFATSHDVGSKIMGSVLAGAERAQQEMIARHKQAHAMQTRDLQTGMQGFGAIDEHLMQTVDGTSTGKEFLHLGPPLPPWTFPVD